MRRRSLSALGILAVALLLMVGLVVASCGGTTTTTAAPTATTPAPTTTAAAATTTIGGASAGDVLYAQYCKGCHADGVTGSASDIETITSDGAGDMPAFADKMSAEEITAVAAYAAGGGK
ncbi:MAG: cytochrome c [bacterium]